MQLKKKLLSALLLLSITLGITVPAAALPYAAPQQAQVSSVSVSSAFSLSDVPKYSGKPYVKINGNKPYFKKSEYTKKSFERYSKLDKYKRCGVAYACVSKKLMPTGDRGSIGMIKPTGWHTIKYNCVDGKYLYNRCHLIAWQLTGENANERNLITGTRYLNVTGMLPFENDVASYVKRTGNHVLYRVTPIFKGSELLARGVLMEAYSVEDKGKGIKFCVYCYNVQPKISITYSNGNSKLKSSSSSTGNQTTGKYILNTNTKKFHKPTCSSVKQMSSKNKQTYTGSRSTVIKKGYAPCKICKP